MINEYVNRVWGGEHWLVNEELYCLKYLDLVRGFQCSLHYHKIKDETCYVLEGSVELEIEVKGERQTYMLHKGDQFHLFPNVPHRFKAYTETASILEVSTHHENSDSYRLEPSGRIL